MKFDQRKLEDENEIGFSVCIGLTLTLAWHGIVWNGTVWYVILRTALGRFYSGLGCSSFLQGKHIYYITIYLG